ncbi:MAG: GGDEF domain-containing protein [Oscillospiraceae bacterium]|nr:GGDEF domain-containing protein [Oscillospiraceae bacterium]
MIGGRKVIALCMSRIHDMENSRFIAELNRRCAKAACSLFIYNINTDLYWDDSHPSAETAVFDLIDCDRTDAIILMDEKIKSRRISGNILDRAHAARVPVVVVDGPGEDCARVSFDYAQGFEHVVRHVIEHHGVRDVHFVAGIPGNPFSDARIDIFRKVLAENGIPFTEDMVSYGQFWAKPAKAAAERLVAEHRVPRAVICANDIMAINVSNVLRSHGFSVPGDVIVTGFDGIDEIFFSVPSITSAKCSSEALAESVWRCVEGCLADRNCRMQLEVVPALLRNASCGCADPTHQQLPDHIHSFNDRFYRYQDDNRSLSEICERMQSWDSIFDTACCLFDECIQDLCCLINRRCLDNTADYFADTDAPAFDDTMFVFFDTEQEGFRQRDFRRSDILPGIEAIMERGFPLIFNTIHFQGRPLGYVCFHFREFEITDYCKAPQVVSTLGIGLGGYITRSYQHYLTQRIEEVYKFDELTGLYNRLSFHRELLRREEISPITVILADLDGLKQINDNFGHSAGDAAIRTAAHALHGACPEEAMCVRYGGDEMLAVIPGACDAAQIMDRIRRTLADFNRTSGLGYRVSVSLGTFTAAHSEDDLERLIKLADASMYLEKQKKK